MRNVEPDSIRRKRRYDASEDRQKFCATIWLHLKRYEKRRALVSYAAAARLFAQLDHVGN